MEFSLLFMTFMFFFFYSTKHILRLKLEITIENFTLYLYLKFKVINIKIFLLYSSLNHCFKNFFVKKLILYILNNLWCSSVSFVGMTTWWVGIAVLVAISCYPPCSFKVCIRFAFRYQLSLFFFFFFFTLDLRGEKENGVK